MEERKEKERKWGITDEGMERERMEWKERGREMGNN